APREAAGNFSHRNLSSRSLGSDFSTMKFSVRGDIQVIPSSLVTGRGLRRVFVLPGDEENQADAGADRAVGDIEGGESDLVSAALLQVKINEVHDGLTAWAQ